MPGLAAVAPPAARPDEVELAWLDAEGIQQRAWIAQAAMVASEHVPPVRGFPSFRGQRSFPYFARLADGTAVVIDVRADDQITPQDAGDVSQLLGAPTPAEDHVAPSCLVGRPCRRSTVVVICASSDQVGTRNRSSSRSVPGGGEGTKVRWCTRTMP